jgi:hypothetical protein
MESIWMEGILLLKEHSLKVQAGTVMEIETGMVVVVAVILEVVVVGVVVVGVIATNAASLAILQGSALLAMVGTGMVAGMTGIVAGMTGMVAGMAAGMTGMVAGMIGMGVAMEAAVMGLTVVVIAILGAVMEEAVMEEAAVVVVVAVAIDTAVTGLDRMIVAAVMNTDLDDSVSGMKAIGKY